MRRIRLGLTIGDFGRFSAPFSTQIAPSALDSRRNRSLHWLFGARESATRRNARSPPQPYLVSLTGHSTATARFAGWSGSVAFPPDPFAGPTSVVRPMARGRHAEQGTCNDQDQLRSRDSGLKPRWKRGNTRIVGPAIIVKCGVSFYQAAWSPFGLWRPPS